MTEPREVSISELRLFRRCRRQWFLKYHQGLAPRVEPKSGPRALGTYVHAGLERYYETTDAEAATVFVGAAYNRVLRDMDPDADPADVLHDRKLALRMLEGYFEWLEDTGADDGIEVVAPERKIVTDSPHPAYRLRGKLDLLVRLDGLLVFLDHKTVADFVKPVKVAALDEQFLMYDLLVALEHPDAKLQVDGGVLNMLRKVQRTPTANPPFYMRHEVRHNRHQVKAFWHRLYGVMSDLHDVEQRLEQPLTDVSALQSAAGVYPTPTKDCSWDCDFIAVCPMHDDGSRVQDAVEMLYVKKDPYDYYEREIKT